jgi:hypothetical protein
MNTIRIHIPALLKKVQEMSDEHMEFVALTINGDAIDQNKYYPAFLYFEAYTKDGAVTDYDCIDAINIFENTFEQDKAV